MKKVIKARPERFGEHHKPVKAKYKAPKRTPEELAEYKQNRQWDKEDRERAKAEKAAATLQKTHNKIELAVLNFMLKTDVLFHHHRVEESLKSEIQAQIDSVKATGEHMEYNPYIWNRQGEGNNCLPKCQMGNIFSSSEFDSIYEVPLDGTYVFYVYDSGERGCGSFNRITVKKVEEQAKVPFVNPGGFPPITAE